MANDATKSFDEEAQELADAEYLSQIGEIANALQVAYECGITDAISAAVAFTGQAEADIRRELDLHFRRHNR